MSKAIEENKLTVTIKRSLWEFNLFWKFICTDKNNEKNKTNFHFSYNFLNYWKTIKPMTLKLSDFQFFFITGLWKIKCKCMSASFCIANLLEADRKNFFF